MEYKYIKTFMREIYETAHEQRLEKKRDDEIDYRVVKNGFVLPARNQSNRIMFGLGGVVDDQRKFIDESSIYSYSSKISKFKWKNFGGAYDFGNNFINSETDVIYLGYILNNWGHFLGQFVTRLWISDLNYDLRYIYVVKQNEKYKPFPQLKEFLEYYGIYDKIDFINTPTRYKRIIIPKPSYVPALYYSDKFKKIYDVVISRAFDPDFPNSHKKIYFSRLDYGFAKRKEVGEDQIKNVFKKNGFCVLSPEKLSLKEQINLIQYADEICVTNGSLAHSMIFAKVNQIFFIINKTHIINLYQRDIIQITGTNAIYIDGYYSLYPHSLGAGPFLLAKTKEFMEFCKDRQFIDYVNQDECLQPEEINYYISKLLPAKEIPNEKTSCYHFYPELAVEFIHHFISVLNKSIYYNFHFSMLGWINNIKNSEFIKTRYQLESLKIVCNLPKVDIEYKAFQNSVWYESTTLTDEYIGIIGKQMPIKGLSIKSLNKNYEIGFKILTNTGRYLTYTQNDICYLNDDECIFGLQITLFNNTIL